MCSTTTFLKGTATPRDSNPALIDNHGRRITYLRLAITDRCNLRCRYCMPDGGNVPFDEHDILSFGEIEQLVSIFTSLGITKVRITGGEPFVRSNCIELIRRLKQKTGVEQVCITTNGILAGQHLETFKRIGISGINLSLDTLCRFRFKEITGSDHLGSVLDTFHRAIKLNIPLKINSVVCDETSDDEMKALGSLASKFPINLRFIEKMGFSGQTIQQTLPAGSLQERLLRVFPELQECQSDIISTARQFSGPGYPGTLGIIEGHSRKFCSTCNKIRITPQGILKTCLYDNGVLDLKHMLRNGEPDEHIIFKIICSISRRHVDGHITEMAAGCATKPSMALIGG